MIAPRAGTFGGSLFASPVGEAKLETFGLHRPFFPPRPTRIRLCSAEGVKDEAVSPIRVLHPAARQTWRVRRDLPLVSVICPLCQSANGRSQYLSGHPAVRRLRGRPRACRRTVSCRPGRRRSSLRPIRRRGFCTTRRQRCVASVDLGLAVRALLSRVWSVALSSLTKHELAFDDSPFSPVRSR